MRAEEVLEVLDTEYPDSVDEIKDEKEFLERKIQRALINHIRLLITPSSKKDK